ncbi:mannonate dehydratase [Streptobacillus moniliformis]|uniref:mannonate dehydratase n=1 Tax=Streptobacillus moniliformis TaxID=34105 RepID=UPI0007E3FF80|nr:mannonate dehydratase [Streptobacillus moniliformis]
MKMTFRWYGKDDTVTLENIRQIPGMSGVVTAIYSVPVGEIWSMEDLIELKEMVNSYNLDMEVIESIPVHEDIKLRRGKYKEYIENYKENIRRCANVGIKTICYNFMPVFDWTRSQLDKVLPDGSKALVYYRSQIEKLDPTKLALPGWDLSYSPSQVKELIDSYQKLGEEGLWNNLKLFLEEIIPVAIECDIDMGIHPDDPPWPIFGIPRIIKNEEDLDRFLSLYDVKNNGITLCSGSLGCNKKNDFVAMVKKYAGMGRVPFAHLRNIKILEDGSFEESGHLSSEGSLDFAEIVKAYYDAGFKGYVRPDHGREIWGEKAKPGYGLYDRALGATYINGLWEMCKKMKENESVRK